MIFVIYWLVRYSRAIKKINFKTKLFNTLLRISQIKAITIFNFNIRLKLNVARSKTEQRWFTLADYNFSRNWNFALKLWEYIRKIFYNHFMK